MSERRIVARGFATAAVMLIVNDADIITSGEAVSLSALNAKILHSNARAKRNATDLEGLPT